jgi:membrane protease YdiL (CAAX protease family)
VGSEVERAAALQESERIAIDPGNVDGDGGDASGKSESARLFYLALVCIWGVGSVAAILIARQRHLTPAIAVPTALAFLVELSFFAGIRRMLAWKPAVWVASAIIPYVILTAPTGRFDWRSAAILAGLASVLCFWLPFLDRQWDWAFLGLVAGLLLAPTLYPDIDRLKIPTLGRLVWFRLGVASVLAYRNHKRLNFGFWPTPAEWAVGVRTALLFLPIAGVLNLVLQFAHLRIVPEIWWKAPGTFFGFLWIIGLAEEVFGRGMLLEWVRERSGLHTAVVVSSLLFGAVHLWLRQFPDFSSFIVATAVGAFCAVAYLQGGGVRASAVTHALIVTVWRTLLSG